MIKTHPLTSAKVKLSDYRDTIRRFLPFVLIRCSGYTNSKRLAELISNYVFICTYRLTKLLDGFNLLVIVECMTGIIGEDLGEGTSISFNGQSLFTKQEALNAAKALSKLDTYECLALVLCYIENLDVGQIAEIMNKSLDRAMEIIIRGQRLFIENLSGLRPKRAVSLAGEIRRSMGHITDCLDRNQFERIIDNVMDYLSKNDNQHLSPKKRLY